MGRALVRLRSFSLAMAAALVLIPAAGAAELTMETLSSRAAVFRQRRDATVAEQASARAFVESADRAARRGAWSRAAKGYAEAALRHPTPAIVLALSRAIALVPRSGRHAVEQKRADSRLAAAYLDAGGRGRSADRLRACFKRYVAGGPCAIVARPRP